jgi:hypothetical protein
MNKSAERVEAIGVVAQDGLDLIERMEPCRRVDDILDRGVERGVGG